MFIVIIYQEDYKFKHHLKENSKVCSNIYKQLEGSTTFIKINKDYIKKYKVHLIIGIQRNTGNLNLRNIDYLRIRNTNSKEIHLYFVHPIIKSR